MKGNAISIRHRLFNRLRKIDDILEKQLKKTESEEKKVQKHLRNSTQKTKTKVLCIRVMCVAVIGIAIYIMNHYNFMMNNVELYSIKNNIEINNFIMKESLKTLSYLSGVVLTFVKVIYPSLTILHKES